MNRKLPYILGFLLLILFLLSPFFIKVRVECVSQYGQCPEEIAQNLNSLNSKTLYQVKKEINKNLSKNLLVDNFSTQFKLPDILSVNIILVKPHFAVYSTPQSLFALVSPEGKILSISEETTLPSVSTQTNINMGESVSPQILFALKLIGGVFDMYQVDKGELEDSNLVVNLPLPVKVIFPLEGDPETLLGSLRLVYSKLQLTPELNTYREIDLRFKNPVLR